MSIVWSNCGMSSPPSYEPSNRRAAARWILLLSGDAVENAPCCGDPWSMSCWLSPIWVSVGGPGALAHGGPWTGSRTLSNLGRSSVVNCRSHTHCPPPLRGSITILSEHDQIRRQALPGLHRPHVDPPELWRQLTNFAIGASSHNGPAMCCPSETAMNALRIDLAKEDPALIESGVE